MTDIPFEPTFGPAENERLMPNRPAGDRAESAGRGSGHGAHRESGGAPAGGAGYPNDESAVQRQTAPAAVDPALRPSPVPALSPATQRWNLFLTGFVILFLELACIRWFAAFVLFLQFFTNIVLIACFVGMSIGCLCARSATDWLGRFPKLAMASVGLALLMYFAYSYWSGLAIDVGGQASPQVVFFGTEYRNVDLARFVLPVEAVVGAFFVLITLTFVGLGQVLGRCFDAVPDRVVAYTLNIAGSLAGITGFALLSWLHSPPAVWFTIGFVVVSLFLRQTGRLNTDRILYLAVTLVLVTVTGMAFTPGKELRWSPYYSIKYNDDGRSIEVNTIAHQQMTASSEAGAVYSLAHLLQRDAGGRPFEQVLIIGAGSGNDIARALRHGARHIDAVEIDPVIQDLGARHHPDAPYSDPRVSAHLTDGRNFLKRTGQKYDLVVFALVDSLILHSSYSSVRLESFLFTEQAFRDVRRVLKDDGVFVMYNYFRQGWIVHRLARMLRHAFADTVVEPLVISLPYLETIAAGDSQADHFTVMLAGGIEPIRRALAARGFYGLAPASAEGQTFNGFTTPPEKGEYSKIAPARLVDAGADMAMATDDWPFLYLREPAVPGLYLRGMLVIGGLGLLMLYLLAPQRRVSLNGRMFFLGAAFLLLETKAVVHLALMFGSTWIVNCAVFFAILIMILGSNLYVMKARGIRLWRHYAALFACLALNCLVPFETFLSGGLLWRFVTPCALAMVPMFFAGVVFAVSFRQSRRPDLDYGANIAGAVVGGLAENLSMLLGFRYLLLVAMGFYALSAAFGRRRK